MTKVISCPREIQLGLAEQSPLVRLLYAMFGNCEARFEGDHFRLSLDREPTEYEMSILRDSDINLKLDDSNGSYWITAKTGDATLTMYMCGPEDVVEPLPLSRPV